VRTREQLFPYQRAAVRFIKEKKRCALFVDPGLGKTAITLTALCDLVDAMECGRTLILAPPQVSRKVWNEELSKWAHLRGKSYVILRGTPKKRRELLARPACLHIMSMELLPWLLKELGGDVPRVVKVLGGEVREVDGGYALVDEIGGEKPLAAGDVVKTPDGHLLRVEVGRLAKARAKTAMKYEAGDDIKVQGSGWKAPDHVPYDAIVVDESSKVKSSSTNRWRALKGLAFGVEYFVELTGTPSANSYEDLWSQIYVLDGGQRLGGNISAFRERWFHPSFDGHGYTLKGWAAKIIEERISDIVFTLREEDYGDLPPRMYNHKMLEFDEATKKKYNKFERTYILKLAEDKKLIARDGAAITTKLLQLASGVVYNEEDAGRVEYDFHRLKLDALVDLFDEYSGQPLLVAYEFKSDVRRILAAIKGSELFDGSPAMEDRWNAGQIPLMLVHRKSAAHGLNLQFGGNNVVWYTLTYSLEDYIQLNKRLHRKGQTKPVMIHHLIVEGTIDEDVVAALKSKDNMQEALLNALKKRIEKYVH